MHAGSQGWGRHYCIRARPSYLLMANVAIVASNEGRQKKTFTVISNNLLAYKFIQVVLFRFTCKIKYPCPQQLR